MQECRQTYTWTDVQGKVQAGVWFDASWDDKMDKDCQGKQLGTLHIRLALMKRQATTAQCNTTFLILCQKLAKPTRLTDERSNKQQTIKRPKARLNEQTTYGQVNACLKDCMEE